MDRSTYPLEQPSHQAKQSNASSTSVAHPCRLHPSTGSYVDRYWVSNCAASEIQVHGDRSSSTATATNEGECLRVETVQERPACWAGSILNCDVSVVGCAVSSDSGEGQFLTPVACNQCVHENLVCSRCAESNGCGDVAGERVRDHEQAVVCWTVGPSVIVIGSNFAGE